MTDPENKDKPETVSLETFNRLVTQMTKLSEQVAALSKVPAPPAEEKKDEKLSNQEMQKVLAQLQVSQKQLDAERAKRLDTELRNNTKEALTKAGVNPNAIKQAMAVLVDAEKTISWNEDQLVFKTPTGDLSLEEGIVQWAKSNDAKIFLPPKGTSGTGATNFSRASALPANPTDEESGLALHELFKGIGII